MAQFLGTVQLGGFYHNGTILKRPVNGCAAGTQLGLVPPLSSDSMTGYAIGDTPADTASRLQWHKIKDGNKTLLICDRNILSRVSWEILNDQGYVKGKTITIDGCQYKCRILTGGNAPRNANNTYDGGSPSDNEWDRFIVNEDGIAGIPIPITTDLGPAGTNPSEEDLNSALNQFWNWGRLQSLCIETSYSSTLNVTLCTARGGARARLFVQKKATSTRDSDHSFRPVLEILNTAPSVPPTIAVPAQVNGGSTVTVSWGASSDAEDNLEGYKAERSLDGGTTWTQIYQGSAQSAAGTVPFGSESVMYRVKAYDAEGLESGWKTSGQTAVINNTAPTVPGHITVPEQVRGGQPLAVSWGASSDGENNLAGYSLERQVNGGDWAVVYTGDQLSFTDQITKGWQTVAYRVRAYDSHSAYSGFAASETRQVNNNTPPAITCELPANTSLGVKSEGFEVPYSVSDEEGDGVTVTEAVDGGAWRTFTAELGAENRFVLGGADFMKLLNGRHTLSITAADGASSAVHSLSFTKSVTAASVTLAQPMAADGPIGVCVLAVSGFIPLDADFTVEVANNALDEAPAWEDCTAVVKTGTNHVFENKAAANGFAFNFRLKAERGGSGIGGYITSVQGGFQ